MPIDQIARLGIRVEAEGPDAARRKLDAMERSGAKAERTVESLGRSSDEASGRIETMATSSNLLAGALTAIGAALSIREIVQYTDTWTNLTNRLRLVTDTSQELADVQQSLVEIAFETRGSLDSTAVLYQRLAQSAGELFDGQEDILAVTKTISQAMLVSGASAQESAGALRQLAQGLASGVLRGDEFNSVMENAPRLQKALIDHLNLTSDAAGSAAGKLRDMAGDGELSARTLVEAFQAAAEDIAKEASGMDSTIGQSLVNLNTGITATIGQLDGVTGASESVAKAVNGLGEKLKNFANDAGAVREVANDVELAFTAVAAILAGKFAGAISKQIIQMGLLNAATYKTTIQTNALGQAISRTTIATRAATVAATGLKSAFAFMGGPVGVITVAALSLATWSSGAEAAERRAESLSGKISQLERKYKDLTTAQREVIKLEIAEEKRSINRKIASLVERRTNLQYGAVNSNDGIRRVNNSSQITKINSQIDTLNQSLQEAEDRLANLGKPKPSTDNNEPASPTPASGQPGSSSVDVKDDLPALERALQEQFERTVQKRLDTVNNLRQSLMTEEEAIAESYRRRNRIIEENVHDPEKREELLQRSKEQLDEEIDTRLQGLKESWLTESELLQVRHDEEMEILDQGYISKRELLAEHLEATRATEEEFRQASLALEGEYQRNLTSLEAKHAKERKKMEDVANKSQLKSVVNTFNLMLGIATAFSPKLFKVQKKLALAKALVTLPASVIESYHNAGGYPAGIPAAAAMAATGAAEIAQLKSVSFGSGGSASVGSGAGSVASGGLTAPAAPLTTNIPPATNEEQGTLNTVQFVFSGPINSRDAREFMEEVRSIVLEEDFDFLPIESRTAQNIISAARG
ncbi:tape measure protein [Microbulbifer epialgicus]|uniref:Tape measure protein n=1 Tax=Microbulbifer epialgicus TaxID=393907 RepID=A0ABV4P6P6_9GAMM